MTLIKIIEAKTIKGRPYTVSVSGYIGNNNFRGDLESVRMTSHDISYFSLSDSQQEKLNDELMEIFPVPFGGKYNQKLIDKIMENGPILFEV